MINALPLDDVLAHYQEHGWARLGTIATESTLDALRTRIDDIMTGKIAYDGLFFQHDTETGNYDDLVYGKGWTGPSLEYRKIEKLEKDPLFWEWLSQDFFRTLAQRVIGKEQISLYRAFLMHKHAGGGSNLPWHQDGGDFWGLDRDPVLQVWTALDDAPLDGGCVEVVSGTHHAGLVTHLGGVVPANHVARLDAESKALPLPAKAGEVLLIHNYVWHRSGRTQTGKPRRAFSVCYMDAETKCRRKKRAPRSFVRVW
jgi:hypothetical protein